MSKKDELQDLDLDAIMNEFHSEPGEAIPELDEDLDQILNEFSDHPAAPARPAAKPGAPLRPAAPARPGAPVNHPGKPGAPVNHPAKPGAPRSAAPQKPAAPMKAAAPQKPAAPMKPAAPQKPAAPMKPAAPQKPAAPVRPTAPQKPAAPVRPAAPQKPAAPVKPAAPQKPAAPVNPAAPQKPVAPVKPAAPATVSGEEMKSWSPKGPASSKPVKEKESDTQPLPTIEDISKAQAKARQEKLEPTRKLPDPEALEPTRKLPDLEELKEAAAAEPTIHFDVPKETREEPTVAFQAQEPTIAFQAPGTSGPTLRLVPQGSDPAVTDEPTVRVEAVSDDPTVRMDPEALETEQKEVTDDATRRIDTKKREPLVFDPRAKLRALKHDLIAGPERRYYELSEMGIGKLQMAVLINLIIVILCAGGTALYAMDLVPENRLRFLVFSQVLAMLISALLGAQQMIDGFLDLFKGRFTVNTMMTMTFFVCCVDAVFSLKDQRVPCCGGFCLEMTFALWARYERRAAEMGMMDTLRKAVRLQGIRKVPDYYQGQDGLVRGDGSVPDFWENYNAPSTPEKIQGLYAFVSFLLCIGIAILAGLMHGVSLSVQVLATSLLVALPASFFVALTRPTAVLERRLHMVGTVLCGWKGVKGLGGSAVFPVTPSDLFPKGSTKLNGVKFYTDRTPDQIVSYTASLILASDGGLVPVFRQLLTSRGAAQHPVVNFRRYDNGGIGGEVCGEPVLMGSLNFLQEMGVEIPEGTMVNQAVYAAIDGELCAVIAISFAKMRSAAAGMVTLCGFRKLTTVVTGNDFILTESFLREKFSISTKRLSFPDAETRRTLAARQADESTMCLALTTREELVSSAYAVTGARSLRRALGWGLGLHMLGGILGMLIMVVLTILNAAYLLTPANVLLYQLVWMIPGLLITEWTRTV